MNNIAQNENAAQKDAVEKILILDFGSQVTQLIARRLRESNVYCEIVPYTKGEAALAESRPNGVILSGGPSSAMDADTPRAPQGLFDMGIPILGICYGQQTMCAQLGGRVEASDHQEFGRAFVDVDGDCALLDGVWQSGQRHQVWMSHGDRVTALPPGFSVVGTSDNCPFAVIADDERRFYGVQFHPEVMHTPDGTALLRNFTHIVAGCQGSWTMAAFRHEAEARIKAQVGDGKVICGLSGGVDSSVVAMLLHEAIGDQLTCVFVDHGLLRKGEAGQVRVTFRDHFGIRLVHVDARSRFLKRLAGVEDPEAKRRLIGAEFIRVFEEEAAKLGRVDCLVQGTIYPDVVESGTATGAVIKTHHNVGGLPADMEFKLIEPLRWLFKDEVRVLGQELGLPEEIIWRQPFPGPGLAVRVLGEVTAEKLALLRAADAIVDEEIRRAGLYRQIWQSFAVLPPMRSVGVMGDERTYGYTIVVRAVESVDAMTADWVRLPYEVLEVISRRLVNEVDGVNRVVYDITSKPPGTIEWE